MEIFTWVTFPLESSSTCVTVLWANPDKVKSNCSASSVTTDSFWQTESTALSLRYRKSSFLRNRKIYTYSENVFAKTNNHILF